MASKTRNLFTNAISLTITALCVRAVSVVFNVYISNKAGSEAMGLFALLGSVYAFSITVACASINLGTTRLVADAIGMNDGTGARMAIRRALITSSIISLSTATVLFLSAGVISERLLGDIRATKPLQILALTLFPVSICSCLTGYFTAVRRVKLNATFQVFSQFIKIFATLCFLTLIPDMNPEQACIALVLGGAIAELVSLVISFLLYIHDRKKLLQIQSDITELEKLSNKGITRKLLKITLPVTFSACIRSCLSMFQHILIPKGLAASGSSWSQALSSYGALHGMALPLILFPSAFIGAFAGLLIPEISECCVQKNTGRLSRVSYRALTMSLIFSIGVSGIMFFYSERLGMLIYNNAETARYIRILAPLIPVMYIDGAVDAILKGSGHQVYSMNVNILDTLTACLFAITLIPKMGIMGYVVSIYATEILNTTLSLSKMIAVTGMRPKIFHQVIMPLLCIIGATNASSILMKLLSIGSVGGVGLATQIIFTSFGYIMLLFITKTVGKDEKEFLRAALLSERRYNEYIEKTNIP